MAKPISAPDGLAALIGLVELLLDPAKTAKFAFDLQARLDETNARIAQLNVLDDAEAHLAKAKENLAESEKRLRAADAFGLETREQQAKADAAHKAAVAEHVKYVDHKKSDLEARLRQVEAREAAVSAAEQKLTALKSETEALNSRAQVALKDAEERLAKIKAAAQSLG